MPDLRPMLCDLGEEFAEEAIAKARQAEQSAGNDAYRLVGEAKALHYAATRILSFVREHA